MFNGHIFSVRMLQGDNGTPMSVWTFGWVHPLLCLGLYVQVPTKKLNWDKISFRSEAMKLSIVFLMQNTRQAIITIEGSMIYSLLRQPNIWHYQITLHTKNSSSNKTVNINGYIQDTATTALPIVQSPPFK